MSGPNAPQWEMPEDPNLQKDYTHPHLSETERPVIDGLVNLYFYYLTSGHLPYDSTLSGLRPLWPRTYPVEGGYTVTAVPQKPNVVPTVGLFVAGGSPERPTPRFFVRDWREREEHLYPGGHKITIFGFDRGVNSQGQSWINAIEAEGPPNPQNTGQEVHTVVIEHDTLPASRYEAILGILREHAPDLQRYFVLDAGNRFAAEFGVMSCSAWLSDPQILNP